MPSSNTLIELHDLSCERADRVLFEKLSLSIEPGQLLEVSGPNGSGKSTLLRVVCGLAQAYSGSITWRGKDLRDCWHQFQHDCLFIGHAAGIKRNLTAWENLRWSSALKGAFSTQLAELAFEQLELQGYEHQPCYTLSAGQQRRVALARLYTVAARLWILDEPFTALDKAGIDKLQNLFQRHLEAGGAILVATHQTIDGIANVRHLQLASSDATYTES